MPAPRYHHLSLSSQNTHDVPHIATQPIITGAGQAVENPQNVKLERREELFLAGNGANGIEICDDFHILGGWGLTLPLPPRDHVGGAGHPVLQVRSPVPLQLLLIPLVPAEPTHTTQSHNYKNLLLLLLL